MNYIFKIQVFVILTTLSGCVSAVSPAREAYILAKPHGWIELAVLDNTIPSRPIKSSDDTNQSLPPRCSLILSINGENYLSENLAVSGSFAPYSLKTGFRISAPEGESLIKLNYIGCRLKDSKLISISVEVTINVVENFVTPLTFNGAEIIVGAQASSTVVTLEAVDARLKNIEASIESLK